jgi:hypothetical protein
LKKNPEKDPEGYEEGMYFSMQVWVLYPSQHVLSVSDHDTFTDLIAEDIAHMRKVVAYCKRHLAQEEKAKQDTNSKSYKSLKNWGHDAQKA